MTEQESKPSGPDLTQGIPLSSIADGVKLVGHVGTQDVLLARRGEDIFAVGAHCTHYHGPLGEGLLVNGTVRCPWHHARFDLRTGEAIGAPAFDALSCWEVEQRDGQVFVRGKKERPAMPRARPAGAMPANIVIVGGGAAGFAAAEMLRRQGYEGSLTMLSNDQAAPVDRPNLSKDYLAGTASPDWVPLRPEGFYAENAIDLRLDTSVSAIDVRSQEVALANGERLRYDRLLLATGAEPVKLSIPGGDQAHVLTLRTLADSNTIIERAKHSRRAVVLGASFIGLEVAASLRARNLEVHVVAPESRPMERILGAQLGDLVRSLHEQHGVIFHLGETAAAIEGQRVRLKSGASLDADIVVVGIGVRPRTQLAEAAGLSVDRGVVVDEYLGTSAPNLFAAGDIARWPDPHTGENIRIEHWVVAERQGQTAAINMLGRRKKFSEPPFFWSMHYDLPILYVGHAEKWDELSIEGDVPAKDCLVRYKRQGRVLAVATVNRDLDNLKAEVEMDRAAGDHIST
jgi:NADPH-dependent 2,4-dienoyl-CoA reductase/sulfur reductase-like enzyme/nitrite reductase/ring-hydroxylating ferredoxin subunit